MPGTDQRSSIEARPQAEELAPGPPWPAVRAFGNVLRHTYDQIDPARIWEIVIQDIPVLDSTIKSALTRLDQGSLDRD